jgi:hypothetical protein
MNSEEEVIKRVLLSTVYTFPPIKPRIQLNRVTGWFNTFNINNWHNSLRKVKNCNKGKSERKGFRSLAGRKKGCIFLSWGIGKMYGKRAMKKKKSKKG